MHPGLQAPRAGDGAAAGPHGRPVWLRLLYVSVSSPRRDRLVLVHILQDVTHQKALAQAVEALATSHTGPCPLARDDQRLLTPRERTVLALLAEGLSTQPIANRLGISPATVGNHIQNLLAKLGAHSRLEAVALATHRQLP